MRKISCRVPDILATAMRICTWNVGGLKGGIQRVHPWLRGNQPDIVGLQEAKTDDPQSVVSAFRSEGYHCELHMDPDDKGWIPGVAILSRQPLKVTQVGLPGQEDRGARLLTASTAGLSFTTVCVPSASGKGQRRIERKLAWLDSLTEHLRERGTDDEPAVLCGDFNITPKSIDNYHHWENTKERKNRPGFREDERSRISSLLEAGWFDLVRDLNPDERMFSWWWSPDYYDRDKGLRMDLMFGNAAVVRRLRSARIDRGHYADRGRTGKPDHAPVVVDLA
ncbi:MAG: exodeoxyribonuclease III [Defluviicoccus sp.]|nr:exodeoxyribonuclease III [Defluviicoccus sp.]